MDKYLSKKEYLKKYDSNVGYALYVQNNIKRNDYVRLNTGEIVRVIGIKENKLNKKAIYYGTYEQDWFDSSAVENFSDNIIDLVEIDDYVNRYRVVAIMEDMETGEIHLEMTSDYTNEIIGDCTIYNDDIKSIVTHEQFANVEYKVETEDK